MSKNKKKKTNYVKPKILTEERMATFNHAEILLCLSGRILGKMFESKSRINLF